jgi:membrane associated rhomboid family serine protease
MFPLRDENPSATLPWITRSLIVINVAVFLYELALGRALGTWMATYALIPLRVTLALQGNEPFLAPGLTFITSMFLHGGWLHLIGNMWYLWIFGDNVEDRMGHVRYLLFYLAGGAASGALHTAMNPSSPLPTVGASGAIAAVLGAYLVLFPRARVVTLVPLFIVIQLITLPAVVVLGLWFVFQFFAGALSLGYAAGSSGGTAWWGHIGGFAFGMLLGRVLGSRTPRASRAWVEP